MPLLPVKVSEPADSAELAELIISRCHVGAVVGHGVRPRRETSTRFASACSGDNENVATFEVWDFALLTRCSPPAATSCHWGCYASSSVLAEARSRAASSVRSDSREPRATYQTATSK